MSTRIRIYQIAKDLGVDSKEMLEFLQKNGYEKFQSIQKTVDAEEVEAIRKAWSDAQAPKVAPSKAAVAKAASSKAAVVAPTPAPAVVVAETQVVETAPAETPRAKKTKKAPVVAEPAAVEPTPVVVPVVEVAAPVEEVIPKTSTRGRKPGKKKAEDASETPVVAAEAKAPVVAEAKAPVVAEAKTPVVAEAKAPVVAEAKAPVVAEAKAPVVAAKKAETTAKPTSPKAHPVPKSSVKASPLHEEDAFEAPAGSDGEEESEESVASEALEQSMLRYAVEFVARCFTFSGFPVRVALGERSPTGQELLLYSNEIVAWLNGDDRVVVESIYQQVGYLLSKALRYRFRSGGMLHFIFTPLQEIDISPAAEVQDVAPAPAKPAPTKPAPTKPAPAKPAPAKPAVAVPAKPAVAEVREPVVEATAIHSAQSKALADDHIEDVEEDDEDVEEFHADAPAFVSDADGDFAEGSSTYEESSEQRSAKEGRFRQDAGVNGKPPYDASSEEARFERISTLLAERAQALGKSVLIDMLNSHERRQIHTNIANTQGNIRTFSDGEGIFRRLVLSPPGITPRHRPSQGRR